jgi:ubiquinone/menaquinone biosynthesis C-methylase UbiE
MDIKEFIYVFLNKKKVIARLREECRESPGHKEHYDSARAVRQYRKEAGLQKPEVEVLGLLRPEMKDMRVLDIGMGTGRTSVYFGTVAREYVAFDFAPSMVRTSRELVGDLVDPVSFLEGDARRMSFLDDHSFDLVLISFNAIDCVSKLDRYLVFNEVRRVAKKGAWFCFSSHNLQSLSLQGTKGPGEFLRRAARQMLLTEANPGLADMAFRDNAMVLDASGHYQLPLYYITPAVQVDQLANLGFRDIRVFSLLTGKEVKGAQNWANMREGWVYYLCRT